MTPMKLLGHAQFHGANRLADKTSRWFWAPALLILLGPAIMLVLLTVKRYQENPTFMVQIDSLFRVKKFPAVVLCPEIKFVEEKMDDFVAKIQYPPGMDSTKMREILPQLAAFYSLDVSYTLPDLLRVEQVLEYNGLSVETVGEILTATCEETALRCRWNHFMVNCSSLFRMEMTGDGFCCVFNGRSLKRAYKVPRSQILYSGNKIVRLNIAVRTGPYKNREMQKHGSDIQVSQPHHHRYTKWFGYTSGLMIAVNQSQTLTVIDISYKWVATESSQHFVDISMNGTALNPGSEQWIAFSAKGYQIALGARSLRKALRKCNMSTDKLRYFPVYSKKYCTLEEEMANTLDKCKCVRVNHPKPPGANICRAAMLLCSAQALIAYDGASSSCPMTCDMEKSSVIASSYKLDESVRTLDPFYKDLNFKKVSVVRVFIQSRKRQTLERWSYYDYLDLFCKFSSMCCIKVICFHSKGLNFEKMSVVRVFIQSDKRRILEQRPCFDYLDLFSQIGGMFSVFFGCSILTLLGLLQLFWHVIVKQCQKKRN